MTLRSFRALPPLFAAVGCYLISIGTIQANPSQQLYFFGWSDRSPTQSKTLSPHPSSKMQTLAATHNLSPDEATHVATVVSSVDVPGFNTTYMELEAAGETFWLASHITKVSIGNTVQYSPQDIVVMENFESKALKRTFAKIYFVPAIVVTNEPEG